MRGIVGYMKQGIFIDKLTSLQSLCLFRASLVLTTEKANKHQELCSFSAVMYSDNSNFMFYFGDMHAKIARATSALYQLADNRLHRRFPILAA